MIDLLGAILNNLRHMIPALLLASSICVGAHEERILTYAEGKLIGLPEKYLPACFDEEGMCLRVNKHTMQFNSYLQDLFSERPYELEFHASWYHEGGVPYMCMRILPEEKDYGYVLSFNMDTLDLLGIEIMIRDEKKTRGYRIYISPELMEDIKATIKTVHED